MSPDPKSSLGGNLLVDGGTGIDMLLLNAAITSFSYNFSMNNPDGTTNLGDGVTFTGCEVIHFTGGVANHIIAGGEFSDYLSVVDGGTATFWGGGGNDFLDGGMGNDYLFGGSGNDQLFGDGGNNHLEGGDGFDTLNAGFGDDYMEGGAGIDTFRDNYFGDGFQFSSGINTLGYVTSDAGVNINLQFATANGGHATGDTFRIGLFQNVVGSAFGDTLIGSQQVNKLEGGDGNDLINGGAGGDIIDGGDGIDTASYQGSALGVSVDLAASTASGGDAQGDTLTFIENLIGSSQADTLTGNALANVIDGNGGNDIIMAGDGDDTIVFNAGLLATNIQGGAGTDTLLINGGTAPTGFNLVTAGIEQARHVVVGANATTTNSYNQAWQLLESTTQNTDGSRLKTSYDPTNASTVWSSITEAFNTSGQLTSRDTFFDATYAASPGGRSKQFFDYSAGINWSSITGNYSASNALMNEVTVLDTGAYSAKYFDFDSSKGWTSILDTFTAGGALATETIVYDTGTVAYSVQTFDTTGQSWTSILQNYSSGGVLMNETTNYDNGQRYVNYLDYQNNQGWTNIIDTFNSSGTLMTETTNYDSGARQVFYNDLTNQTWTNITDLFDTQNRLDTETTRYDNGNLVVTDFDQNITNNASGEYAWARDVQTYNASSSLIEHYRVMDDGSIVYL